MEFNDVLLSGNEGAAGSAASEQQPLRLLNIDFFRRSPKYGPLAEFYQEVYKTGSLSHKKYIDGLLKLVDRMVGEQTTAAEAPPSMKLQMPQARRFTDARVQKYNRVRAKDLEYMQRSWGDELRNELVHEFEMAVESHSISPVLAASTVILLGLTDGATPSTPEERIQRWCGYFLREPEGSRLYRYNAFVVSRMGEGAFDDWRDVLDKIQVPLLPDKGRLARFNRLLLQEASRETAISGGHTGPAHTAERPTHETLYKRPGAGDGNVLEGGGYQAPVLDANKAQIGLVDLSELEAFLADMSRRLDELRQEERAVGAAVVEEIRAALGSARTTGFRNQRVDAQRLRDNINRWLPKNARNWRDTSSRGGSWSNNGGGNRDRRRGDGRFHGGEEPSPKN